MDTSTIPRAKTCTQCGIEKPLTTEYFSWRKARKGHKATFDSSCKVCHAKATHQWNVDNPEKKRESDRKYDLKRDRDKERERTRRFQREHRETVREYCRRSYRKHRDKTLERNKRERQNNPDQARVISHNRRTRVRGLPSTFTKQDWIRALDYFHGCCAYCGAQQSFWHIIEMEHYIPVSSENCPGTTAANIVPACSACNLDKFNQLPQKWLLRRFGKRKAMVIERRIADYFEWVITQCEL